MKDLTKHSISTHILTMAAPVATSMLTQIACQLVTLYFVASLGAAATAGVNAASNAIFIVIAFTQVLGVGTAALVSHAVGRKDQADANLIFNQSMVLSAACGAVILALLYALIRPYLRSVAADSATIDAGTTFISWALPGYALIFPWTVLGSALRGTGIVQPTSIIYMLTVIINAVLAPILIAGWGTDARLGVKGAGLATSISILIGVMLLTIYSHRLQRYLTIVPALIHPRLEQWRRILAIGLPAGSEFALTFLSAALVYYVIRDFGASAQAGFGIGSRVLQAIALPAMAIAFAAGPVAGQNFGAKNGERVKETFRKATLLSVALMVSITVLVQWRPTALVSIFEADDSVTAIAASFLQITSWTLVAQALVYTCSTMFQGFGNTVPTLIGSATRFAAFSIPTVWLSTLPGFYIEQVWYLSIVAVSLQAIVGLRLLRIEFRKLC